METKQLTIGELADSAELAPSLVSRLLTDSDSARRDPRLEHVLALARALERPPGDVVAGTDAEQILTEWVPRAEFVRESAARTEAQAEAATARTDLAGAQAEAKAMKSAVDGLSGQLAAVTRQLSEMQAESGRQQAVERAARNAAEARLAAALVERNSALAVAQQNYQAWANAKSFLMQAQRELDAAKGAASAGWITAALVTITGLIIGAAASDPGKGGTH